MPRGLQKPVFIIGSARSGTGLMRQILNRHPQVMIWQETHYFDDLRPRVGCTAQEPPDPGDKATADAYFAMLRCGAYGLNGTEHARNTPMIVPAGPYTRAIDALFQQHCLGQALPLGKDLDVLQIWDEKTPRHVFCLPEIVAACPRLIHGTCVLTVACA